MLPVTLTIIAMLEAALAMTVWRARPASAIHRLFAFHTLAFAGWTLASAGTQSGSWLTPWGLTASMAVAFASASLIPAAFLLFVVHYPTPGAEHATPWQHAAVAAGIGLAIASLTTPWVVYDTQFTAAGLSRRAGPLYPVFALYFLVVFSAAVALFLRKWRSGRDRARVQLTYFGVGVLVAGASGVFTNLLFPALTGRSTLSHIGPTVGLIYVGLTAHTIIRHRFLDLRVLVRRSVTFGIAAVLSLLPVGALVALAWPRLVATFSAVELLLGVGALVAAGILIPPTKDRASRVLDRYLYRSRVNPQRVLRETSTALSRAPAPQDLARVLTEALQVLLQPESIAVSLAPLTLPPATHAALDAGAELLLRDEATAALRTELEANGWAAVLPLRADREILGVVVLGTRRSGDPFFSGDVDTLVALGNSAAAALSNLALLGDRARAERLESLQRASRHLAHELGNLLVPIKTFARLLPARHADPAFIANFTRIAGRELDRMEQLAKRLSRVAPEEQVEHGPVDLREPITDAVELARTLASERRVEVRIDLAAEPLSVSGDTGELEELFLNLLTNAIEAIDAAKIDDGVVALRAYGTPGEIVAIVEDSGPGIDPAVAETIFDPFVSTRSRGSGLGLSICAAIAERHRGRLTAHNGATAGAVFTLALPRLASRMSA